MRRSFFVPSSTSPDLFDFDDLGWFRILLNECAVTVDEEAIFRELGVHAFHRFHTLLSVVSPNCRPKRMFDIFVRDV
jgi:hypothetical protein